eukprot:255725_1
MMQVCLDVIKDCKVTVKTFPFIMSKRFAQKVFFCHGRWRPARRSRSRRPIVHPTNHDNKYVLRANMRMIDLGVATVYVGATTIAWACIGWATDNMDRGIEEVKAPQTVDDVDYNADSHAGGAGIFGPPQDITKTLNRLGVSRYEVIMTPIIFVLETTEDDNRLKPLSVTTLPSPAIVGPLFVNVNGKEVLDQEDKKTNDENEAVRDYQTAIGSLEVNGIADAKTRKAILDNTRCENIDPFAKNDVVDKECGAVAYDKKDLQYFIGIQPGYLKRDDWKRVIENGLNLSEVEEENNADI